MVEDKKNYIAIPANPSVWLVLGRLGEALPELNGLSVTREIGIQRPKDQEGGRFDRIVFINGPEDQRSILESVIDNLGLFASPPISLEGLPIEDIDNLLRLAKPEDFYLNH